MYNSSSKINIVYTGGTFDLFHIGHVELLQYCRLFAGKDGRVVVALNTDEFVKRYKGNKPAMNYEERYEVLKACRYVDYVIPNENGEDSKPTILKVRPTVIVIGMDWIDKDYASQMNFDSDFLNSNKIALAYVPRTKGTSTSDIKRNVTQKLWTPHLSSDEQYHLHERATSE